MRAAYLTLGCKVNQYDTDAMEEILQAQGYETVDFSEKADVYVINSCTVTAMADKKSRQMIHRAYQNNPHAVICVCGCMAQQNGEKVLQMEGVSAVIGTQNRAMIADIVEQAKTGQKVNAVKPIRETKEFERLHITRSQERTRANIKICEGCDNFCTYCIIPFARGPVRSRAVADVVAEAIDLAASGVKEVVLTGIHIGSYGKDLDSGEKLIDVIEAVSKVAGIARIRLGSMEPSILSREFCERASRVKQLCPHFHVSLQSGSKGVLKRMNRRYSPEEYAGYINNARDFFIDPAITTDVIADFAGETEAEHAETLQFLQDIGFSKIHVFPYSEREGTAAVRIPGPVPKAVRKERGAQIAKIADGMTQQYLQKFLGTTQLVLVEELEEDGRSVGHNERYIPIRFVGGQPNTIVAVSITAIEGDGLTGQMIN
ncbi:MAG: tRNA (N(6)-L-threonylcarbamoyladenosine(37)-C(2))-methylthiotransferase MtaB [Christensenellaceae bacterium]|nr:tRNA (N(6)-L-threonylcarbamoyladenosine(37)-C(2))-methylthiotransferase MtaB [Christensenellaceae bacterium]